MSDRPASNKTFEARFEALKTEAIAIVSSMYELGKHVSSEDHSDQLHTVDEGDEDEDDDDDEDEDDDEHDDDETRTNKKKHAAWDRDHASIYKEHSRNASVQQKYISDIKGVYWEQPDNALANEAHINNVYKMLQSAWAKTRHAEKYSDAVEQCIAKFRLLNDDLILANRPPDKHEFQLDQQQMILDMSYMLTRFKKHLETLDGKLDVQIQQTIALIRQDSLKNHEIEFLNKNLEKAETDVKSLRNQMNALQVKVDHALIARAPATTPKTWRTLWKANMSPEMQTLPDLLAQLQRPATP